jgi:hypothetical protein
LDISLAPGGTNTCPEIVPFVGVGVGTIPQPAKRNEIANITAIVKTNLFDFISHTSLLLDFKNKKTVVITCGMFYN